jgi:hypothetical protein
LSFVRARGSFLNGNARTFNAAFTETNLSHSATRQQAERLLRRGNSSQTKNTQRSPEETFIVNEALENGSMIVLGKLKGIRRNGEGRKFNTSRTCHRCGHIGLESEASSNAQNAATPATQTTTEPYSSGLHAHSRAALTQPRTQ